MMAGCITQANVKFSNMIRKGNGVYQDLVQDQEDVVDGHDVAVELKMSPDGEDDRTGSQKLRNSNRKWKSVLKIAALVIVIFFTGYLFGYVTHHNPGSGGGNTTVAMTTSPMSLSHVTEQNDELPETESDDNNKPARRFVSWSNITAVLREKLTTTALQKSLQDFSSQDHRAGSDGDHSLGQKVLEKFRGFGMGRWLDVHYVKLQVPSSENKVLMESQTIGSPKGYLAYSATGTKQGKVVYANYGRIQDLEYLKNQGVALAENIALMRAGELGMAEKVDNAARFGLTAVLIYREPVNEGELDTELYGQVHLGTGDPYTPGFPSFNHTQFPPSESSGLPKILAQTITAETARKIHLKMRGKDAPADFAGMLPGVNKYTLGGETNVTVTVNNVLEETKIYNVFGVIKGFVDPDRYVVLGAQRDSFGPGFAGSTVGTALLVTLAEVITDMMKDGFKPRRSIVFGSWSGGDFGSIGATEWLEGFLSSLNLRAFTYISLDATVSGLKRFKASSSPLLHNLLKETMDEVSSPRNTRLTITQDFAVPEWTKSVLEPMVMQDGAFPFLTFSGIPSISFRFVSDAKSSEYFGTVLDTRETLNMITETKLLDVCVSVAQLAGQMALRLVHDHLIRLDVGEYTRIILKSVKKINTEIKKVEALSANASTVLKDKWLNIAVGLYSRAVSALNNEIKNSDLTVEETCRKINDRIMRVEHNLLSPYVSPRDVPFRHIIYGSGNYSVGALLQHLSALKQGAVGADADLFRNQFALITSTVQSCANDLAGDVWALNNLI